MKLFDLFKPKTKKEIYKFILHFNKDIEKLEVERIIKKDLLPLLDEFPEEDKNLLRYKLNTTHGDIIFYFSNEATKLEFMNHPLVISITTQSKLKPIEYPVITIDFSANIEQSEIMRIIEIYILPLIKEFSETEKNIVIGGDYGLAKFVDLKRRIDNIEIQFGDEKTMSEFINHPLIKLLEAYIEQMNTYGYNSPVVYSIEIDSVLDYPADSCINKSIFRPIFGPLFSPYYSFVSYSYNRNEEKLQSIDIYMYDGNSKFMCILAHSQIINKLKKIGIDSHFKGTFQPQYKTKEEFISDNLEVINKYEQ